MPSLEDYRRIQEEPQTLEAVLAARDRRASIQAALIREKACPVMTLTVNMPGPVKRTALSAFYFHGHLNKLQALLEGVGARIESKVLFQEPSGDEAVLAVSGLSAQGLKSLALCLEDQEAWSRLLDLDVLDPEGQPVKRAFLGLPARTCLVCGQRAAVCSTGRLHALDDLTAERDRLLMAYASQTLADRLAGLAAEASSFELMLAPKPGLVTPFDAGSHRDMDRFTFVRSQSRLLSYYGQAFLAGWTPGFTDRERALRIRLAAIGAEEDMLTETGGVNTHRGWIYTAGIFLMAMGSCLVPVFQKNRQNDQGADLVQDLARRTRQIAQSLETSLEEEACLSGLWARQRAEVPIRGARQEALSGFPSVFTLGLPVLRQSLLAGRDGNSAGLRSLLAILASVQDTTLIKRGGPALASDFQETLGRSLGLEGRAKAEALAEALVRLEDRSLLELMTQLSEDFSRLELTCGGAADLAAASRLADRFLELFQAQDAGVMRL